VSSSPLGRYKVLPEVSPNDGWTAYETVFQDAGHWLKSEKQTYLFPMMYYRDHYFYPFLNDWIANSNGRLIAPGLGVYQMDELKWPLQDITNQMQYIRDKKIPGAAYFRTANVLSNLKRGFRLYTHLLPYSGEATAADMAKQHCAELPN
jgi:hypothetical protein